MVFLGSWLFLADHQTRCSINYAWLDLNGFFSRRLGLVIREPAHVEQPCPPGRGITPVQRKPTLWQEENRGKHNFLLACIHLWVSNVPNCVISQEYFPSAAWLWIPCPLSLLYSQCPQPFPCGTPHLSSVVNVISLAYTSHLLLHTDNKISPSLNAIIWMCSRLAEMNLHVSEWMA